MCGYSSATLTEIFPCFFLIFKANARVKVAKTGQGPHSSKLIFFVLLYCYLCCSMYCLSVNVYGTTATECKPNCN